MKGHSFINDLEKMDDFRYLKKKEFLKIYPYLNKNDYEATLKDENSISD